MRHVMDKKIGRIGTWSMKDDRELIALSKTEPLKALVDHFQRPPKSIRNETRSATQSADHRAIR